MSKAKSTQTLALLTKRVFTLEEIQHQLKVGGFACELDEGASPDGVTRPQLHGSLLNDGPKMVIDVLPSTWPEEIPADQDWGAFSCDGGLQRACQHNVSWDAAAEEAAQHQSVVVLRLLAENSAAETVQERLSSLIAMAKVNLAIGSLPDVVGYFCPGGEVFITTEQAAELLQVSQMVGFPPLDLFANLRLSWLDQRWVIFETIGNGQLGLPDFEVYADSKSHNLNELASWLRRWSWQQFTPETSLQDGTEVAGPGEAKFTVMYADDALLAPVRSVIRMISHDEIEMPEGLPQRLRIDRA